MSAEMSTEVGTVTLSINGIDIATKKGSTILSAAEQAGIYIPSLCHHPSLRPYGGCRLCLVQVEGMRGFPTSCTTAVEPGMKVRTNSEEIEILRRNILELILSEHPNACLLCERRERCEPQHTCQRRVTIDSGCIICPANRRCELQNVADYLDIKTTKLSNIDRKMEVLTDSPFFARDYNLCILCGRCVRVCQEVRGAGAIAFINRGSRTIIGTAFGANLQDAGCQSCGACVDVCPTGALIEKSVRWQGEPDYSVDTTCPYCGVGCQLKLEVNNGQIINSTPVMEGIANEGQACVKGKFGIAEFVQHPDRLKKPLIKRNGQLVESSWEEAIDLVVSKFKQCQKGQFALISSAKITNEENYLAQKFARVAMGTNNVDHCARLCHAPSVVGLAQAFGSGAMTNPISDIVDSKCIFVIGSNTSSGHPVIALKIQEAVKNGAKLIVANPREINLCQYASIWLQQIPGSDVALLMGMMRVILDEGLADLDFIRERCENYEAFLQSLQPFDLSYVEKLTKVPASKIVEASRVYATQRPSAIIYAMGITQHSHGTDNVLATANLSMLTGNIGRPSAGVNPLRGQNNVQGACDMGALPNVYSGYQPVNNVEIQKKFEMSWGRELCSAPGLTLPEMLEAAYNEEIRCIYLIGENPVLSEADASHVEKALKTLDFLVVQDIFLTETAKLAHVVLPSASFAEKDGTFTNTERRIQRVRKVIPPAGSSKPDWEIICLIAKKMSVEGFEFINSSDIMTEISKLTGSYGGINYDRLEKVCPQWPCPSESSLGTPVLHMGTFVRGKGKFTPLNYRQPAELPDNEYPLLLTTGRSLYHFHTGTMTRKVAGLNLSDPEALIEINHEDATRLDIKNNEIISVTSRRGRVETRARITEACPAGVVYMNFHFAEAAANVLTNPVLDPASKIPEFKVCAVRVEKNRSKAIV